MKNKPVLVERHAMKVWENSEMDALRRENCMCLFCGKLIPQQGDFPHPDNCRIAQKYFALCKLYGNAFIMTRCSQWVPKPEVKVDVSDEISKEIDKKG